jgi:hypothetical protein
MARRLWKSAEYLLRSLIFFVFLGIVWYWPHDASRTVSLWVCGACAALCVLIALLRLVIPD